jgi:phage shock protein PspC (stress-responsive transcriptional regulator)
MSAPYSAPRRLERSRNDRFIGGVCGGIAKYLNMDPTLVRILTVVITLFTFVPVVAYLIAMFVMPEESADDQPSVGPTGSQWTYPTYSANGQQQSDPVWGAAGAPWEQPQPAAKPTPPANPSQPATPTSPAAPSGEAGPQR